MPSLSSLKPNNDLKIMVYGQSGVGKSVFASTFPGPVYIADFDGKISSAAGYLRENDKKQLEQVEFDSFLPERGKELSFDRFTKTLNAHSKVAESGSFPYKTYVIDSMTLFYEAILQKTIKNNPGIKRVEASTPSMMDYRIAGIHFKQFVSGILALPCNVVFTAHSERKQDETTGEIQIQPLISGKLAAEIPIRFKEVYYLSIMKNKEGDLTHALQTRTSGTMVCRTQIPGIPQYVKASYNELKKYLK